MNGFYTVHFFRFLVNILSKYLQNKFLMRLFENIKFVNYKIDWNRLLILVKYYIFNANCLYIIIYVHILHDKNTFMIFNRHK
jgi:hypothetical protein